MVGSGYCNDTIVQYYTIGVRFSHIYPGMERFCSMDIFAFSNDYWPAPPTIHRGLEWPQFLNCSLFDCLFVLCLSANFLILLLILLFYSSVSCVIYL